MFLISFVLLYLELALIRWVAGYIVNFAYFTNFVLLACFLGMGISCLQARRKTNLIHFFPWLVVLLITFITLFQVETVLPRSADVLFWGETSKPNKTFLPLLAVAPIIFVMSTLVFVCLSHPLGRLFGQMPRLRAYTYNIAGSLLGIVAFAVSSYLSHPPVVWFAVAFLASLPFLIEHGRTLGAINAVVLLVALGMVWWMGRGDTWGPYYRQTVEKRPDGHYALCGNSICGIVVGIGTGYFYDAPYWMPSTGRAASKPPVVRTASESVLPTPAPNSPSQSKDPPRYRNALIIGCGAGNEAAVALAHDVPEIDCVDINPWVIKMGRALHPAKPFASNRVTAHIDDARAFLRNSNKKYDLIVYGLTDSTITATATSNLRVESFLFTLEAFRSARDHLSDRGLMVIYNDYRHLWLVQKIREMLRVVFNQEPFVSVQPSLETVPAVLATGPGLIPGLPGLAPGVGGKPTTDQVGFIPASDDWPYLYLRGPTVPTPYLWALALVAASSLILFLAFRLRGMRERAAEHAESIRADTSRTRFRIDYTMFFMGAAFMLLEARSVTTFGLFFGLTWRTNTFVFAAILVMVLLAILLASVVKRISPILLFVGLLASLAVAYAIPSEWLLINGFAMRLLVVGLVAFLPIFFANLLFARLFRDTDEGDTAFGSNLLGGLLGGMVEYLSMITGYRALVLLATAFYLLAVLARSQALVARARKAGKSPTSALASNV
jgi:Spermine/spermidine synthase domain